MVSSISPAGSGSHLNKTTVPVVRPGIQGPPSCTTSTRAVTPKRYRYWEQSGDDVQKRPRFTEQQTMVHVAEHPLHSATGSTSKAQDLLNEVDILSHSSMLCTSPQVTKSDEIEAENLLSEYGNELLLDTQFTQNQPRHLSEDSEGEEMKSEDEAPDFEDSCLEKIMSNQSQESNTDAAEDTEVVSVCKDAKAGYVSGDKDVIPVMGFQSASGKEVTMSSAAQAKARLLVEDACDGVSMTTDMRNDVCLGSTKNHEASGLCGVGLQSASGKALKVKQQDLARFQKWLDDDLETEAPPQPVQHHSPDKVERCKISDEAAFVEEGLNGEAIQGFKSASGKQLQVCRDAIAKFEKWVNEDNFDSINANTAQTATIQDTGISNLSKGTLKPFDLKESVTKQHKDQHHGFQALRRNITSGSKSEDIAEKKDWSKVPKGFRPFKAPRITTRVGEVEPSALSSVVSKETGQIPFKKEKDNASLRNWQADSVIDMKKERNVVPEINVEVQEKIADSFPSNKELTITQINDVSKGLADFLEHDASFSQIDFTQMHQKDKEKPEFIGEDCPQDKGDFGCFQTASGGTVLVSDAAIIHAQKLLEPEMTNDQVAPLKGDRDHCSGRHDSTSSSNMDITGFCTAKGTAVKISDQAMNEAKRFVDEGEAFCSFRKSTVSDDSGIDSTVNRTVTSMHDSSAALSSLIRKPDSVKEAIFDSCRSLSVLRSDTSRQESYVSPSTIQCREVPSGYTPKLNLISSDEPKLGVHPEFSKELFPQAGKGMFMSARGTPINVSAAALDTARAFLSSVEDGLPDKNVAKLRTFNPEFDTSIISRFPDEKPKSGEDGLQGKQGGHLDDHQCGLEVANNSEPLSFPGFSTAAGKHLTVTTDALNKAKQFCDSVDITNDFVSENTVEKNIGNHEGMGINSKIKFVGFKTASGNSVAVSASAVSKAKHFLSNDEDTDSLVKSGHITENKQIENETEASTENQAQGKGSETSDASVADNNGNLLVPTFSGFQSASGKTIDFSAEKLDAARKLLNEGQSEQPGSVHASSNVLCEPSSLVLESSRNSGEYKSEMEVSNNCAIISDNDNTEMQANRDDTDVVKLLPVCDSAVESTLKSTDVDRAKAMKHSESPAQCQMTGVGMFVEEDQKQKFPLFDGFQTEKGNKVSISDKSLHAARHILNDENYEAQALGISTDAPPAFSGFQTAKGGKVSISINSLNEARKLLLDSHDEHLMETKEPGDRFVGFQTAKGKIVNVSSSSLQAAKKVLHDQQPADVGDDEVDPIKSNKCMPEQSADEKASTIHNKNTSGFSGFQTAKGNTVSVSAKALKAAKSLLEDDNISNDVMNQNTPIPKSLGFQTANGAKVDVSEDSLKAVRNVSTEQTAKVDSKITFNGFHTAKGNKVDVSADSLSAVKDMLSDTSGDKAVPKIFFKGLQPPTGVKVSGSDFNGATDMPKTLFKGFQTAKGSKVDISIESLNAAKTLLADTKDDAPHAQATTGHFQTGHCGKVVLSNKSLKDSGQLSECRQENAKTTMVMKLRMDPTLQTSEKKTPKIPIVPVFRPEPHVFDVEAKLKLSHRPVRERSRDISMTQEAMESTKALLADGDFDEETWEPARSWMKPVAVGPEGA